MSRATPRMRYLAKHVLAYDTPGNKPPEAKTPALFHAIDKLRPHLVTLMGQGGFRALLSRALVLANAEVSWLRAMQVKADGALDGLEALQDGPDPTEREEGQVVLLAQLLGLLVAFIGPGLTLRLVGEAWPQILLDGFDFGDGDIE